MVTSVERADPPPAYRRMYDWAAIAAQMKAAPMEWHKVFDEGRVTTVNAIRQGGVAPVHPELGFEVMTRNNKRTRVRTCTLYMRYNPEKVDTLRQAIREARGE